MVLLLGVRRIPWMIWTWEDTWTRAVTGAVISAWIRWTTIGPPIAVVAVTWLIKDVEEADVEVEEAGEDGVLVAGAATAAAVAVAAGTLGDVAEETEGTKRAAGAGEVATTAATRAEGAAVEGAVMGKVDVTTDIRAEVGEAAAVMGVTRVEVAEEVAAVMVVTRAVVGEVVAAVTGEPTRVVEGGVVVAAGLAAEVAPIKSSRVAGAMRAKGAVGGVSRVVVGGVGTRARPRSRGTWTSDLLYCTSELMTLS